MLLGVRDETVPNAEPASGKRYLRLPLLADFLERAAEVVEDVANVGWCADGNDGARLGNIVGAGRQVDTSAELEALTSLERRTDNGRVWPRRHHVRSVSRAGRIRSYQKGVALTAARPVPSRHSSEARERLRR